MEDLPRERSHRLHWQIGQKDRRSDRKDERRQITKALIGVLAVQVLLGLVLSSALDPGERRTLIGIFLALWLLIFIVLSSMFLSWRSIQFEVITIVDLPPDETSERLEKVFKKGVPKYLKKDRIPWLHGEQAMFKVAMGNLEMAYVIVELYFQSYEGPTKIIVRSAKRRDDWWDLRGLIEEAFHDVGVPGGWSDAVGSPE